MKELTLDDFVGDWTCSKYHTNPHTAIPGIPAEWVGRVDYFPPDGMLLRASVVKDGGGIFRKSCLGGPQELPSALDLLKFECVNPQQFPTHTAFIERIAKTEYHLAGNVVVSSPSVINPRLALVEVIELLESDTLPTGQKAPETRTVMRHWVIWTPSAVDDGTNKKDAAMRAMWPCCLVKV